MEQTRNPFFVKSGEYVLQFQYSDEDRDMNDCMVQDGENSFPRAMSQTQAFAHAFGECRESQISVSLLRIFD